ncbi:MAG: hypothetical protein Q4C91_20755 [Eubacteriales bacterium]|nr:hypothetical protein [Eubacteriales bacterium]
MTDYGAGAYDTALLQKLFSGRSGEQIQAVSAALSDYPEVISIYRGEAEGSTPYHRAFSWSIDINAAFFFACRHGDKDHAKIIRAKVRKKDIMAAILDGSEKEIIVLPGVPFEVSKEQLIGPGSPLIMPPKYLDEYVKGRERIRKTYELHKSARDSHGKGETGEHDMVHSARVLFLAFAIIQARRIKLSKKELEQLSEAIVYHDIGRSNDAVDDSHGAASRKIYECSKRNPDAVTAFLIEYHCLDDELAQDYLTHSLIKGKSRAWLLYQILKDADALDRVRFGILDLDVNFLRLPISHKLVPLAVAGVSGIKM